MGPNTTTFTVGAVDEYGPFLAPEVLMAAVQGRLDSSAPVALSAYELAGLYLRWIEAPHEAMDLREQVADRINAIDAWIHGRLPRPRPGVLPGTDSVGGVVARVAEAWACAYWTLHHGRDEVERHQAWEHLAEMRQGYEGLIRLALEGMIILPKSWRGIGWPGLVADRPHHRPTG